MDVNINVDSDFVHLSFHREPYKNFKTIDVSFLVRKPHCTLFCCRYINIIEMHINHNIPVMLVGPTATGKTFYFQKILKNTLCLQKYVPVSVLFTRNVTASFIQVSKFNLLFNITRNL